MPVVAGLEFDALTEEQQWAKLAMIVDISKEVWK